MFHQSINVFRSFFGLSFSLAIAEFKLKNEGSYLGLLWYLLAPTLTTGLLFVVFNNKFGVNIPYFGVYMFIGVILFNFFQSATVEATTSIIRDNIYLIKSLDFDRKSLIASIVLKNLFSHFFEVILLIFVLFVYSLNPLFVILYIPVLFIFSIFTFGVCLMISSLSVYFVDMINIWNFGLKLVWLGTPIFYVLEEKTVLYKLNLINPLYYFITLARSSIINLSVNYFNICMAVLFSFTALFVGLIIFSKLNRKFAELI